MFALTSSLIPRPSFNRYNSSLRATCKTVQELHMSNPAMEYERLLRVEEIRNKLSLLSIPLRAQEKIALGRVEELRIANPNCFTFVSSQNNTDLVKKTVHSFLDFQNQTNKLLPHQINHRHSIEISDFCHLNPQDYFLKEQNILSEKQVNLISAECNITSVRTGSALSLFSGVEATPIYEVAQKEAMDLFLKTLPIQKPVQEKLLEDLMSIERSLRPFNTLYATLIPKKDFMRSCLLTIDGHLADLSDHATLALIESSQNKPSSLKVSPQVHMLASRIQSSLSTATFAFSTLHDRDYHEMVARIKQKLESVDLLKSLKENCTTEMVVVMKRPFKNQMFL